MDHNDLIDKSGKVLAQIRARVDQHDDGGCRGGGNANGVMMAFADIERLGWEEGDVVYPSKGVKLHAGGQYGILRLMCDECGNEMEHDGDEADVEVEKLVEEHVEANSVTREESQRQRELIPTT